MRTPQKMCLCAFIVLMNPCTLYELLYLCMHTAVVYKISEDVGKMDLVGLSLHCVTAHMPLKGSGVTERTNKRLNDG